MQKPEEVREPTTKSLGKGLTQEDKARSKALKSDHAWHVLETPKEAHGLEQVAGQGEDGKRRPQRKQNQIHRGDLEGFCSEVMGSCWRALTLKRSLLDVDYKFISLIKMRQKR